MSEQLYTSSLRATNALDPSTVVTVLLSSASGSISADRVPRHMPASIPADQAYYWSTTWQQDIREAMAALAAGDYEDFDSDDPNDVVRWFLSED